PLSTEGSVLLASTLYRELLLGEHPIKTLHRLRTELHSRYGAGTHDWASLVVYEALPPDLENQLETYRYGQTRDAVYAKSSKLATLVKRKQKTTCDEQRFGELREELIQAVNRLPHGDSYEVNSLGTAATAYKELAECEFNLALAKSRRKADTENHFLL